jgi:hypothetical protein
MPRQIGWSQESNLLYNISMQLDRLAAVTAASGGGGGGGTITGSGTAGQVTYWSGSSAVSGSNLLFWNTTNTNLGIGLQPQYTGTTAEIYGQTSRVSALFIKAAATGVSYPLVMAADASGRGFVIGQSALTPTNFATGGFQLNVSSTGGSINAYTNISTGTEGTLFLQSGGGKTVLGSTTDLTQRLQVYGDTLLRGSGATSSTTALTVQNSSSTALFSVRNDGNVGIGVTPSDWGSAVKALQIGSISGIALIGYNQGAEMGQNVYYTTTYKYATAAAASIYVQNNGRHFWRTASSGTANANLTFTTAMMLDEFGKLGIINTPTAYLDTAASTTTAASLRIRSGVAPTTPNDGDIWATSTDLLARVSNNTYSLIGIITANRQTVNYSLVLADNGKLVEMNVGAANTLTVPPNSSITFPIGTKIDIAQYGAGQTTIVPGAGVTVRSAGGALKLSAQYSGATIVKIGTDEWYLFGDITV